MVTVTFVEQISDHPAGEKEFKCHKMILCRNSEYFKTMFGRSNFKESEQPVVELHEDDSHSAEVVLRYIYGFDYEEIEKALDNSSPASIQSVTIHMNNLIAAQKYPLHSLETAPFRRLEFDISLFTQTSRHEREAEPTLRVIELLLAKSSHHREFTTIAKYLVNKRLPDLYELPDFRELLETEPWKDTMEMCLRAVRRGHVDESSN